MACRQKHQDKQHSGRQPKLLRDGIHRDNFGDGLETFLAVFDKTVFVKLKVSNNFKQNIDEKTLKTTKIHRKIHTILWILKISRKKFMNQKSRFCDFQKENHTLGYGFKNP